MEDPSGKVLDMNIVNEVFRRILSSNAKNKSLANDNYKKYLKDLTFQKICEMFSKELKI